MSCSICDAKKEQKIFEDSEIIAFFPEKPASMGHVLITTKKHFERLASIPQNAAKRMFFISQQLCSIIQEHFPADGTNVVSSEKGHFAIHVIPRKKGDGIKLEWQPKAIPEESMAKIHDLLKVPEKKEHKKEEKAESQQEEETDFMIKHLRRIP